MLTHFALLTVLVSPLGGTSQTPRTELPPAPMPSQGTSPCSAASSFGALHAENDSWLGGKTDQAYTQGLEFRGSNQKLPGARLLNAVARFAFPNTDDAKPDTGCSFALGQTIFTPRNLLTYSPSQRDRPFGAFLYYTAAVTRVLSEEENATGGGKLRPRMFTAFATVGLTGKAALGRDFQGGWHLGNGQRIPKGWLVSALATRPEFQLGAVDQVIFFSLGKGPSEKSETLKDAKDRGWWGKWADVTVGWEAVAGTVQTYGGLSASLRIGRQLTGFATRVITFSAAESDEETKAEKPFEFSFDLGGRLRRMVHNEFVSGFDEPSGLRATGVLPEWAIGGSAAWKDRRLSYRLVTRRNEFEPRLGEFKEWHRFSMIDFSTPPPKLTDKRIDNLGIRVALQFGRATSVVKPEWAADRRWLLASSRQVEWSTPLRGVTLGWERSGSVRESGPPVGGSYQDLLLLSTVFTAGYERAFWNDAFVLQIRGGAGRGSAKLETTIDTRSILEPDQHKDPENGGSAVAAVRLTRRLGGLISVSAEWLNAWLDVGKTRVNSARFSSVLFGFQLHPFGRDWKRKP